MDQLKGIGIIEMFFNQTLHAQAESYSARNVIQEQQ